MVTAARVDMLTVKKKYEMEVWHLMKVFLRSLQYNLRFIRTFYASTLFWTIWEVLPDLSQIQLARIFLGQCARTCTLRTGAESHQLAHIY